MESISNTNCGSLTRKTRPKSFAASDAQAEKSPPKSKGSSRSGQGKDGTPPVASTQPDSEIGLSILQNGFEQALTDGLKAKLIQMPQTSQMPQKILIEVWGASICPECQMWTGAKICTACGHRIG